jgi:tetratricopeptide (TPR) repeat protein
MQFWRMTRDDFLAATQSLESAIRLYPDHSPARSLLGFYLIFAVHMGWIYRSEGLSRGRQHATRAIALDDRDPWGQIAIGYSALMERHTEEAVAAFRRAVSFNPNSAIGCFHLSHGLAFAGEDREAIEHAEEAIRLSPLDPMMAQFLGAIAVAHYLAGRYSDALHYTTQAAQLRPGFQGAHRLRCASLARTGQIEEAQALLALVCREQPQISAAWIRANVPYQTPDLMNRFLDGMRMAGLEH